MFPYALDPQHEKIHRIVSVFRVQFLHFCVCVPLRRVGQFLSSHAMSSVFPRWPVGVVVRRYFAFVALSGDYGNYVCFGCCHDFNLSFPLRLHVSMRRSVVLLAV